MVQGGLKKVQGGLEPPLAPHFPRLWCIRFFIGFVYVLQKLFESSSFIFFATLSWNPYAVVADPSLGNSK